MSMLSWKKNHINLYKYISFLFQFFSSIFSFNFPTISLKLILFSHIPHCSSSQTQNILHCSFPKPRTALCLSQSPTPHLTTGACATSFSLPPLELHSPQQSSPLWVVSKPLTQNKIKKKNPIVNYHNCARFGSHALDTNLLGISLLLILLSHVDPNPNCSKSSPLVDL